MASKPSCTAYSLTVVIEIEHKHRTHELAQQILTCRLSARYIADFLCSILMTASSQTFRSLIASQANKPVIGIVQDTLLGCRLMTKRDTFIEKDVFMNILMWLEDWDGVVPMPAIIKPRPLWTGKQVCRILQDDHRAAQKYPSRDCQSHPHTKA